MNLNRNIPFSAPEMSEAEIQEVADAMRSGWTLSCGANLTEIIK